MKNLLKFTAVVAACTLVSCSNDFDELGSIDQPTAANELKIVAEEMGGGSLMRSAYVSESSNDRVWQETDKFQVFGAEIVGKTDSLVNLCEYMEIFRISSLVFTFLSINLQNNNTISQRDKMNNLTKG